MNVAQAHVTSISLPASLNSLLEKQAKKEHRTKSGLMQEAIRYYLEHKQYRALQQQAAARAIQLGLNTEDDVENLIDEIRS